MDFEWDPIKAASNSRKHGVDFMDAATVLYDELAATIAEDVDGETRHVTLGVDAHGSLLVVVYAWRGNVIRIISARKATVHERRQYEEEL